MEVQLKIFQKYVVPLGALLLGVIGWFWLQTPSPLKMPKSKISHQAVEIKAAVVTVYVTGKVASPGVIELPLGSRVIDAILAAGGMTIETPALNLAQTLVDGEHIKVLKESKKQTSNLNGKINLNTANQIELETIAGIGPVMANRIIEFRSTNGTFKSLSDLDAISGVGPALLAELSKSAVVQ